MIKLSADRVAYARRPDRLYPILPCPDHGYYAGQTAGGLQLVAGV